MSGRGNDSRTQWERKRDTCGRHGTPTKTTYTTDSVRQTENRAETGSARWTPLPRGLFINYGRVSHYGVSGLWCLYRLRVVDELSDYVLYPEFWAGQHWDSVSILPLFENSNPNIRQIVVDNVRVVWKFSNFTKHTRNTKMNRLDIETVCCWPGSRFDYQYLGRCISPEAHNRSFMRQCRARISPQRLWNAFSRLRYCLSVTSRSLRPISTPWTWLINAFPIRTTFAYTSCVKKEPFLRGFHFSREKTAN